jgi:hypothetical protein
MALRYGKLAIENFASAAKNDPEQTLGAESERQQFRHSGQFTGQDETSKFAL